MSAIDFYSKRLDWNLYVTLVLSIAACPIAIAQTPNPPILIGDEIQSNYDECAEFGPGWIFCSGFEEGLDIWDDYDGNPEPTNKIIESPSPSGASPNKVMRLWVPPGRGGADIVKELPRGHSRLYARWYVQWEAGYDFNALNHGGGLHAGSRNYLGRSDFRPNGSDWFTAWIEPLPGYNQLNAYTYYPGMYMDCADPNGSCWGDHFPCLLDEGRYYCTVPEHRETVLPPPLQAGKWYCIEQLIDAGNAVSSASQANGIMSFWVNDFEVGPWNKLWFRSDPNLTFTVLWLSTFFHGEHSDVGVLFDNVVVSTERIGCNISPQ